MKELSIEEKARAYDNVVKKATNIIEGKYGTPSVFNQDLFDYLFPELKESDDEVIRKWIIDDIKYNMDNETLENSEYKKQAEKAIAWLEKQGNTNETINRDEFAQGVLRGAAINLITWIDYNVAEDNMCLSNMECEDIENALVSGDWDKIYAYMKKKLEKQGEQKPADKVEPKFKVGDYVVGKYISGCISEVRDDCYMLDYQGFSIDKQDNYHLWTIKDAKDGDVLKEDSCIFIIKRMEPNGTAIVHCCLFDDGDFSLGSTLGFDVDSTYPATKEQRNTFFDKMKEAGYEWDAEKKELKKIADKSSWCEEDEGMLNSFLHKLEVCDLLSNKEIIWIKNKFKSLKERYTWKPSNEQIKALEDAIDFLGCTKKVREDLKSLHEQLKKLKE